MDESSIINKNGISVTLVGSTRYSDPKIKDLQIKLQPKCLDDIINKRIFLVLYLTASKENSLSDEEIEAAFCMSMNTDYIILCNYINIDDQIIENIMICALTYGSHKVYSINPINRIGKFDISCIKDTIEFIDNEVYKLSMKNNNKGE